MKKKFDKKAGMIGIKPEEISLSKKKEKRLPEKYFRAAAKIWIEVYGELLPKIDGEVAQPVFWEDGAEKRSLKIILTTLRVRAEEKNIEWTESTALERLKSFLLKAWTDNFVSNNFMLRIINNNKTKIFNNQITPKYGTDNRRSFTESPRVSIKPKGGFGKL